MGTVWDAIANAERILPGIAAPEGECDPRWQAIIRVAEHIESEPEAVWEFTARWVTVPDDDLQSALATCVIEHLLEHHFERVFPLIAEFVQTQPGLTKLLPNPHWRFGQASESTNSKRLDELIEQFHS